MHNGFSQRPCGPFRPQVEFLYYDLALTGKVAEGRLVAIDDLTYTMRIERFSLRDAVHSKELAVEATETGR